MSLSGLRMNFTNILKNLNNQEEVKKPWGRELIWSDSNKYLGKILYINKGSCLSLQYHNEKEETVYVLSGILYLHVGDGQTLDLKEGDSFFIPSGLKHRFEAKDNDLVLLEVSTYHLDDVVRIEDDYGRV